MNIKFKNLMFEVTRRCGMECAHCMRGNAQNKDMSLDVIEKVIQETSYIEHLTITGGEPSLAPDTLKWLIYYIKNSNCEVGSFFCATNAQKFSKEFIDQLDSLYQYCTKKDKCILTISTDQFHSMSDPKALEEYRKLPYYNSVNEKRHIPESRILNEGRAAINGIGRFSTPEIEYIYDISFTGFNLIVNDRIYVNAHGDILLDADLSYIDQEDWNMGNVMETDLSKLLIENRFIIPDSWYEKGKESVYRLYIKADAGTIMPDEIEYDAYFSSPQKAIAAYKSATHNIILTPVNTQYGKIPDGLELQYEKLPAKEYQCEGAKYHYKLPDISEDRSVIFKLIRCPIEEDYYDI